MWPTNCLCPALVQMCFSFNFPLSADPVLGPYVLMVSDVYMQDSFPLIPWSLFILFICTCSMSMSRFEIVSIPSTFKEGVFPQHSAKCSLTALDSLGSFLLLSLHNHSRKLVRQVKGTRRHICFLMAC